MLHTDSKNGTNIADIAFKEEERYRNIGSIIYYRSHDAELRLDLIPVSAWAKDKVWFFGNFIESDKVPVAPYIEGDILAATDKRGSRIPIGHIHTRDNEHGDVQYYLTLYGVPVGKWRQIIASDGEDGGKRSMFLPIKLEDK